jgi:hypothetical protein
MLRKALQNTITRTAKKKTHLRRRNAMKVVHALSKKMVLTKTIAD